MRNIVFAALLSLTVLPLCSAFAAARDDVEIDVRGRIDLGDFEIVIGDSGGWYEGWDDCDTRVYAKVRDGRRGSREHYFDSLAAALFVLREQYGRVRLLELGVPEYAGGRHLEHGHAGHGLIDGFDAYYVWDDSRLSRGGLPLLLAFSDYYAAREEAYWRDGELLELRDVARRLYRWADRQRDCIYWRGWEPDRWTDSGWHHAWGERWQGWGWDDRDGWIRGNQREQGKKRTQEK